MTMARLMLESRGYKVIVIHPSKMNDNISNSSITVSEKPKKQSTTKEVKVTSDDVDNNTTAVNTSVNSTSALLNLVYNYATRKQDIMGTKVALLLEDVDGDSWNQSFPFAVFEQLLILHNSKILEKINHAKAEIAAYQYTLDNGDTMIAANESKGKKEKKKSAKVDKVDIVKLQNTTYLFSQLPCPYILPLLCPIVCTMKNPYTRDKLKGLITKHKVVHIQLKPFEVQDIVTLSKKWLCDMNLPFPSTWLDSLNQSKLDSVNNQQSSKPILTNQPQQSLKVSLSKLAKYRCDIRKLCNDLQFDSIVNDDECPNQQVHAVLPISSSYNKVKIPTSLELNLLIKSKNTFELSEWLWSYDVQQSPVYASSFANQIINKNHPRLLLPLLHEHYLDHYRLTVFNKLPTTNSSVSNISNISNEAKNAMRKKHIQEWSSICKASQMITRADQYIGSCLLLQDWRFEQYATQGLLQTLVQQNPNDLSNSDIKTRFPPSLFSSSNAIKHQKSLLQSIASKQVRRVTNSISKVNLILIYLVKHWLCLYNRYKNFKLKEIQPIDNSTSGVKVSGNKSKSVSSELTLVPNKMILTEFIYSLGCVDEKSLESIEIWKSILKLCQC